MISLPFQVVEELQELSTYTQVHQIYQNTIKEIEANNELLLFRLSLSLLLLANRDTYNSEQIEQMRNKLHRRQQGVNEKYTWQSRAGFRASWGYLSPKMGWQRPSIEILSPPGFRKKNKKQPLASSYFSLAALKTITIFLSINFPLHLLLQQWKRSWKA